MTAKHTFNCEDCGQGEMYELFVGPEWEQLGGKQEKSDYYVRIPIEPHFTGSRVHLLCPVCHVRRCKPRSTNLQRGFKSCMTKKFVSWTKYYKKS